MNFYHFIHLQKHPLEFLVLGMLEIVIGMSIITIFKSGAPVGMGTWGLVSQQVLAATLILSQSGEGQIMPTLY